MIGRKNEYTEIIGSQNSQVLFFDQEEITVKGYKSSFVRKWTFYFLSVAFCGIPALIISWFPQLMHLKYTESSLNSCNYVLVKDENCCHFICSIHSKTISLDHTSVSFQRKLFSVLKIKNEVRYFLFKDIRYIWIDEHTGFQELRGWDDGNKYVKELEESVGYTAEEQKILLQIYDENNIKVAIPTYWKILMTEILRPFYLFQTLSIILWFVNDYASYAICVVVLMSFSVSITMYTTKKQKKSVLSLVRKSAPSKVLVVRRGGVVEEIDPSLLVPGDVIQIPQNGYIMPCDAILLHGNCIVNEYILTGESCPVTKTQSNCSNVLFNSIILKRHVLFCGTEVVQTRYYGKKMVTAVTVSTGFSTMRGELIRSLLHPKPLGFKFYQDSIKFVYWLFFIAICGFCYFFYLFIQKRIYFRTFLLDSLDLITIVVPPALPAALTAGVAYSRNRLLSKGIFCISPPKINVFGKLKLMCFDKTGTLTEEGLDLWGLLPCHNKRFTALIENPSVLHPKHPLVVALATCHTLTVIQGKICGNPLDLSVFKSLNWELSEPGTDTSRYDLLCPTVVKPKKSTEKDSLENLEVLADDDLPYEIGIVREFPFTSDSRCISVITRQLGVDHMNLYCKGAPEKVQELCAPDSLPSTFNEELQVYTSMGFRVIAVAYKQFDSRFTWRKSQRVKRQEVETELKFLGLIVMQNKLKPVSTKVIDQLRLASIRCVMITGDNLYTAVSVSRECLMVLPGEVIIEVKVTPSEDREGAATLSFHPVGTITQTELSKRSPKETALKMQTSNYHYVMDGKTWELLKTHFSHLVPQIIVKGTVFARMLPEQKTQLVECFQDLDYVVGMCGDGANDFGDIGVDTLEKFSDERFCGDPIWQNVTYSLTLLVPDEIEAMKVAHVGVVLSQTECSVIAPFTSKVSDVSCIISLVQEGRCALISTFVIFKYMAIYSLIQFMSVLIIYQRGVSFGNIEFLYVDLIVTSLLALVIGRAGPSNAVVKKRPIARLMSFGNLFPLFLQVVLLFSVQMSALKFLEAQSWFEPVVPKMEGTVTCWENAVVYYVSLFQYLTLALVYSKGRPYRQPFYNDFLFMAVFWVMTAFAVLLTIWPFQSLARLFELNPVEDDSISQTFFRFQLLIFPVVNLILSLLIENLTDDKQWLKNVRHFLSKKKESKNSYKRILSNLPYHVL